MADPQPSQLHPYISVLFSSKPISLEASPKLFVPPTATARTRLLQRTAFEERKPYFLVFPKKFSRKYKWRKGCARKNTKCSHQQQFGLTVIRLALEHAACCPHKGTNSAASTREGESGQPAQSALHSAATLLCNNARVFLSQGLRESPTLSANFPGFTPGPWAEHRTLGFAGSRAVGYQHTLKALLLQAQMPSGPGEAPLRGADRAMPQRHVVTLEQRLRTGCSKGKGSGLS